MWVALEAGTEGDRRPAGSGGVGLAVTVGVDLDVAGGANAEEYDAGGGAMPVCVAVAVGTEIGARPTGGTGADAAGACKSGSCFTAAVGTCSADNAPAGVPIASAETGTFGLRTRGAFGFVTATTAAVVSAGIAAESDAGGSILTFGLARGFFGLGPDTAPEMGAGLNAVVTSGGCNGAKKGAVIAA